MNWIVRLGACIVFLGLFAPAAQAADEFYFRFGGGAGFVDEDSVHPVTFDPGYIGTAAIGKNWFYPDLVADLRIELEAAYRDDDVNEILGFPATGRARAYSVMVNGILDVRTNLAVVPYLGIGLGATHLRYWDDGAGLFFPTDDEDTMFAYQVMGGFTYNLAGGLALGIEYRFHETEAFELVDSLGLPFVGEYNHHSVMLTISSGF